MRVLLLFFSTSSLAFVHVEPRHRGGPARVRDVFVDEEVVLGQGTYGVVYAARDAEGRELVAKTCRADPLSRKYFEVERAVNERLKAADTDSLYVGCIEQSRSLLRPKVFLVFERVAGGRDLGSYLADGACGIEALAAALGIESFCASMDECWIDESCSAADPEAARSGGGNALVAAAVLEQVLASAAALHKAGVCHRDLKPANLLVDPVAKRVRLIDFGSALDVVTRVGADARRSPVSPRYCPPEQFVDETQWKAFDSYPIGITALRLLLSPALRSDNDLDAFNEEFRTVGHGLDAWLGSKMAETALPIKLLAPLSALRSGSPSWDRAASGLWRLLCRLTARDPRDRVDCSSAAQAARAVSSRLLGASLELSPARFAAPPAVFNPTHHHVEDDAVRATLAAPLGVGIVQASDEEDGVAISEVFPGGSAAKLGTPRAGDKILWFEWLDGRQEIHTVEEAEAAMRRISPGALFEVGIVPGRRQPPKPERRRHAGESATMTVGAYRRRGSGRDANEDTVAVGYDDGVVARLDARDWPKRADRQEELAARRARGWTLAMVADGHGGQAASIHCARRMPELFRDAFSDIELPEAALRASFARCSEEFFTDEACGAVAAAACVTADALAVLHCGDARVVASDSVGTVVFETKDHVLTDEAELRALEARGGKTEEGRVVADEWRVAVPRAIGGRAWRRAGIVAVPESSVLDDLSTVAFVIVASDGLWRVFTSREAALYVAARRKFRPKETPSDIARHLCERATTLKSTDDVSAAIVILDDDDDVRH